MGGVDSNLVALGLKWRLCSGKKWTIDDELDIQDYEAVNKRLKSVLSYCYHCIHPGREERSREEERRKEERGGIPLIGGNNSGQDVQVCRCAADGWALPW